jgi:hypothetical protein
MSKENCLELYLVGHEWMLFDEKEHPQNMKNYVGSVTAK